MAGLFEKLGLVRTEYGGSSYPAFSAGEALELSEADALPEIDMAQVSYENVIRSIYNQGGIDDENSIFKIKAYIDVLPSEMTKTRKMQAIAGILTVEHIDVESLIQDGLNRNNVLTAAVKSILDENNAVIAEAEADIEHLKAMIEEAEARIMDAKKKSEDASCAIHKEMEDIAVLVEFANGVAIAGKGEAS